tara:strand:+ start:582 stop:761 length:180 start_codon:yes stop_codon:yes gene_type:complete
MFARFKENMEMWTALEAGYPTRYLLLSHSVVICSNDKVSDIASLVRSRCEQVGRVAERA